jgi:hypothetical protein
MQRVSMRTLALMLALLLAVVSHQYMAVATPAKAGAIWLAGDCTGLEQSPCIEPGCTANP